jgi:chloramphenicol-sensitive protein RarD
VTPPPPESDEPTRAGRQQLGIRAAVAAYVFWGLLTIYWKQLGDFGAFELIGWRIAGACVVMVAVVSVRRRWRAIHAAFANRRLTLRIALTAALLTTNWTAYVYAVVHDRVIEAALGYFMAPLGTMVLGITVLGERTSAAQKVALVLAAVAVAELTVTYGEPPVIAVIMAVAWSLYGLLKRRVALGAIESFAAESFVLFVPAVAVIAAVAGTADGVPRTADGWHLALVLLAGVATAVPLVLFGYAATRVPLTILGPLQYLVPTITFVLGWAMFDEDLPWSRFAGFGLVWVALLIVTVDRVRTSVAGRTASRVAAVSAD